NTSNNNIYVINTDSVLIEVIPQDGMYHILRDTLLLPSYGMTELVDNGEDSLRLITGKFPIAHLRKLDSIPNLVNYARPYYPPVNSRATAVVLPGIAYSQGDAAMRSDTARMIFGVDGSNVKVGVISNSYNTQANNKAGDDVIAGDLPSNVELLLDYPYGRQTDEGRAMMQIVHDVAPGAQLAFRTGYISAGDFAEGIKELQQANCDVIVDDISYITEPFFQDGVISHAVNAVRDSGVVYIAAAGNYGSRSYGSTFNPVTAPSGFAGHAHDFGGGDVYQRVNLPHGTYTIVLQWEDSIYSRGQLPGVANDLDIYLLDTTGNIIFGFNRNNIYGDPLEVMPFIVKGNITADLLITRAQGNQNVRFKYIVFRGEMDITEHNNESGTVVGQSNAQGAITVGAVLYTNTPAYGVSQPTVASFSSRGGNILSGESTARFKPNICAPNGVNTTVKMGGVNIDGDALPNFFGTSAAAPHIAGVAALVIDAQNRFNQNTISPDSVRDLISQTALDMYGSGYDINSGYGFVRTDSLLARFSSPKPVLYSLAVDTTVQSITGSTQPEFKGAYFNEHTKIIMRDDTLPTQVIDANTIIAEAPAFEGNPPFFAYNPPTTPSGLDGGNSDSLYFFSPVKKQIVVRPNDVVKYYGEDLPLLSFSVTVDGQPLDSTQLTLNDLNLTNVLLSTSVQAFTNPGLYPVTATNSPLSASPVSQVVLDELYKFTYQPGVF
ncbi:MAG TPA: S8 family serine peptidase, partial [Bacteroidia bacterium]|nr:S8 family serine peptidase [Bacteroidia bacterium]